MSHLPMTMTSRPAGGRPLLWAEPFTGTFSVGLRLLFGDRGRPLTGYLGSKRRLADVILRVLGLRPGQGAESVYLQDAGCWGGAWSVLLDPAGARAVAAQLRSWKDEDPRALWERLAKEPPPASWSAETAVFLALQAGNARGRPVGLEGVNWKTAGYAHLSDVARAKGFRARFLPEQLAGKVEGLAPRDVAAWMVLQGSQAANVAIWPGGEGWRFDDHRSGNRRSCRAGRTMHGGIQPTTQAERIEAIAPRDVARWLWLQGRSPHGLPVWTRGAQWMSSRSQGREGAVPATQRGTGRGQDVGLQRPEYVAAGAERLGGADWPPAVVVPAAIQRVSPLDVLHRAWGAWPDLRGTYWMIDPPYTGEAGAEVFTGYGHRADRGEVLDLARQLDAAGAVVAITEAAAVREIGDGWYHVDLSHLAGRQRLKTAREWMTLNRPPAIDVGRALPRARAAGGQQLGLGLTGG